MWSCPSVWWKVVMAIESWMDVGSYQDGWVVGPCLHLYLGLGSSARLTLRLQRVQVMLCDMLLGERTNQTMACGGVGVPYRGRTVQVRATPLGVRNSVLLLVAIDVVIWLFL